jgi:S1-C subfamily serine protease
MRYLPTPAQSLATAALLAGSVLIFRAEELPAEKIYSRTLPSVLTLRVESKNGDRYVGTAFLALKEGVAVTAWHVIYDAAKVTAKFSDGVNCDVAGFIDYDETKDIAIIPIDSKERPLLSVAGAKPMIGMKTYVIGSPKGYEFSIGDGLLSQIQKVDGFSQYQVSCPFSPGNSGGPILNNRGEVMGIAAWTRNGAQNLNFATPATETAQLNADKPITLWKQSGKKKPAFTSDMHKRSSPVNESAQTAQELKKLFGKSTGKSVTVTVVQEGQQEKFTFTVPSDFVK